MTEKASEPSDPLSCGERSDPTNEIDLLNEVAYCSDEIIEWVTHHFNLVIRELQLQQVSLSIAVVDDEKMSDLHLQYSNIPGTTDVLTFDLLDEPNVLDSTAGQSAATQVDGEIIICADEAKRRADELNHPLQNELLLYLVHGLLHLLGYDDHDPEDHRIMHLEEDRLLNAIGVGAVFHADSNASQVDGEL